MAVFYKEENNIGFITFDQPDAKVNVLNAVVLGEFDTILDEVAHKSTLKALVIQSAKKDIFIAGADIKEIETICDAADARSKSQAGQNIFNKLEDLKIPTIAVIDGVALGGGCELALACRFRVATFNEKVRIGLPEVNLGFVPGWGGTFRLPRLLGLQGALKLILSGNPVDAKTAFKMGLVDRIYPQTGLGERIKEFVEEISIWPPRKYPVIPLKGIESFLERNYFGRVAIFGKAEEEVLKITKGFYPAPIKASQVIHKSFGKSRSAALDIESSAFAALAVSPISKNLVKLFYLADKFKKLSIPEVKPNPVRKAGVIGAGIMGGGIAQLLSHRGVWVRLKDINYEAIAKGLKAAFDVYKQALKRKRMKPADVNAHMSMISGTLDYSGFVDADIVIEAVVENMEIKKKVFAELSQKLSYHTILASNTSSLSLTEIGRDLPDASRVIGFHFFNPVHRMPLIEIIKTQKTCPKTVATMLEFAKRLGKTPIVVKDAPGFLVNRILLVYINEAGRLLGEGASIMKLDQAVTKFGMPMGPFTLSDEVGLDVGVKVLHILHEGLGERFKPCPVFEEASLLKLLGKKGGKGFYIYDKKPRRVNVQLRAAIKAKVNPKFDYTKALDRMMYIMINEASRILEEGVVDGPDTVDIGMIMGTGFPAFRGGLLRYADSIGVEKIIDDLNSLEAVFKDGRFKPANYLLELKAKQQNFFA